MRFRKAKTQGKLRQAQPALLFRSSFSREDSVLSGARRGALPGEGTSRSADQISEASDSLQIALNLACCIRALRRRSVDTLVMSTRYMNCTLGMASRITMVVSFAFAPWSPLGRVLSVKVIQLSSFVPSPICPQSEVSKIDQHVIRREDHTRYSSLQWFRV
jgi:hypothetical protein